MFAPRQTKPFRASKFIFAISSYHFQAGRHLNFLQSCSHAKSVSTFEIDMKMMELLERLI
jgi:hypothetical protein